MKRLSLLIVLVVLVAPVPAFAQLTELGVVPFGSVINDLYSKSLQIVGLAVFIMFLIAGMSYILPDQIKPSFMKNPITIIQDAVIGTILLFSAYVILNTLNPALVGQSTTTPGTTTGTPTLPGSSPTPSPQCTDLQVVFDMAIQECAAGDAEACAARSQIIAEAMDVGCVLTGEGGESAICVSLRNSYTQFWNLCNVEHNQAACDVIDQIAKDAEENQCSLTGE
jgi:hypothetical protein